MKAMFGVVSLLVALAIVGLLAARQLKTAAPSASSGAAAGVVLPDVAASGTVREQSQQIQQKVKDDVTKALQQGAAARKDTSDQ